MEIVIRSPALYRIRSEDNPNSYICIAKCASTSLKRILISSPFSYHRSCSPIKLDSAENFFSVVRDPIQRWVSGVVQYIEKNSDNKKNYKEHVELVFEKIKNGQYIFDEHTIPQVNFLYPFAACNVKLFSLGEGNLIRAINNYYQLDLPMANHNKGDKRWYQRVVELTKDEKINNYLKYMYADDFVMYDTLQVPSPTRIQPLYVKKALLEAGFTGFR